MSEPIESDAANFRTLVERNADAIIVLDPDGIIQLANPAAGALFRRDPGELAGSRFGHPIVPGAKAELQILRRGADPATAEMRLVDIEWKGRRAFLATLRDVTDRKRAQQDLDAARREQLELKDRLLSHVSHELRNPLAALHEFVSLVLDGVAGPISDQQREYLEIAFRNAKQLGSLIDDLAEVGRAQSGKLRVEIQPFEPSGLLRESVWGLQGAAGTNGVELRAHAAPGVGQVLGDETRTRQVLGNLIENAIKFTPKGGSIVAEVGPDPDAEGFVRFSVKDTGCGIREDLIDSIFDRLQQDPASVWRSRKGLGLGLFICRELVQRQGGHIWVESTHGRGSNFQFRLPEFSFLRMLRPVLQQGDGLRDAYSLVRVDLVTARPNATVPVSVRRHAQQVLQTSIYPEVDVLLPRFREVDARFWIVAGTGQEGMQSLSERLRKRLSDHEDVTRYRVGVRVEGRVQEIDEDLRRRPDEVLPLLAQQVAELTQALPALGASVAAEQKQAG